MTAKTIDQFFTSKHAKLYWIASITNVFTWLVLGISLIIIIAKCYEFYSHTISLPIWEILGETPAQTISLIIDILDVFMRGSVFTLVLRGISLALNMIIETELNYREKYLGDING